MKNLIQRAITGFLFVGAIIGSISLGKEVFALLFLIVTILTLREFYSLTSNSSAFSKISAIAAGVFLYSTASLWSYSTLWALLALGIYTLLCLVVVIAELYAQKENPLHNWAYFFLGQVYVVVPFTLLNTINNAFEPIYLLALFILIWTYDSGAYLFGITLGKHRLFERISPKKSWEGAIGGLLAACGASLIFAHFSASLSPVTWLGFASLVVVAGTFGDLTESLLKRTLNIKDSGNILPGHGGMLDRFDSLLFATPVIIIYLALLLGTNF